MANWASHSTYTDPGPYAARLAALSEQPAAVVRAVQGLLIHGEALEHYGLAPRAFNRQTLTVEQRLEEVLAQDARPLSVAREPGARGLGTCRDYALLVCAIFRHKGFAARVRCGFASYFGGSPWEDHWVCEVLQGEAWTRIDAQLDPVMRQVLGTTVEPEHLPATAFADAGEAWLACRSGRSDPNDFSHGEATGLWLVFVNLMRDRLALQDRLTSSWDDWRGVAHLQPTLDAPALELGDRLASGAPTGFLPEPWWLG